MPPSRPVTMHAIALAAGVSVMTVSRVLRGRSSVTPVLRDRVHAEARRLGYQPNPMVQSLMTQVRAGRVEQGSAVVAFLVPQFDLPDWGRAEWIRRMVAGATERAASAGFKIETFAWQRSRQSDERLDHILWSRGVRGVIVGPLALPGERLALDWTRYAVAAVGASLAWPRVHRVRNNAFHSIRLAVRELVAAGHRRIGLAVSQTSLARVDSLWSAGFLQVLHEQKAIRSAALLHQPAKLERAPFLSWWRKTRPDALLTLDPRAYGWLRESGVSIPRDVTVASLNRESEPLELAGVDQAQPAVGAAAADLVIEQIYRNETGIPAQPKDVLIEGWWVPGHTAAPLPAARA